MSAYDDTKHDDVMERLMSIQPLPRGERMAQKWESFKPGCAPQSVFWWDYMVDSLYLTYIWGSGSSGIRSHAAPLRKCRDEHKRLREENRRLREEVADLLAGADADALVLTQAGHDIDRLYKALEAHGNPVPPQSAAARRRGL